MRGTTVEVVPKDAFELFRSWYALSSWSKPIWREVTLVDGVLDVEINPVTFTMCTCGYDGEPRVAKVLMQVSRGLTVEELLPKAAKAVLERYEKFENEADEKKDVLCKLWYSNDSNLWILLGVGKDVRAGVPELVCDLPMVRHDHDCVVLRVCFS